MSYTYHGIRELLHNLSTHNHTMKSTFRFLPSNVDRCEAFKREHDIAMGCVQCPTERNVCARTAWETLAYSFPTLLLKQFPYFQDVQNNIETN